MRKFLITCITSKQPDVIKAGKQFEAVEDNSFLPCDPFIVVTGVINGCYLSAYISNNMGIVAPVVDATFSVKELE